MISVKNLEKSYAEVQAVKGISFAVKEGSLFSFLGVNGAGKSTTINMLTTLLPKTAGQVTIGGYDIDKNPMQIKSLIGIVFQDSVLDGELTVEENLYVRGSLYHFSGKQLKEAVNRSAKLTQLSDIMNQRYQTLSGGQRRRADIARALINQPKLLFLDEPTTGLDPKTRKDIWKTVRDLQRNTGMTVFLTTHYMEEAAESDHIEIIHKGEIKANGTPVSLKEAYAKDLLKLHTLDGQIIEKQVNHTVEALPIIDRHRGNIAHVEIISGTLDDVFLNLTQQLEKEGNSHVID